MPTRLPVLLHSRKSAAAGAANSRTNAPASESIPAPRGGVRGQIRLASRRTIRIIALRTSRGFHLAVNEDGAEVIDVGEGGARAEEIAQALEKSSGIVVGKKGGRIEAEFTCPRGRRAIDVSAGGIVGRTRAAIGAVRVSGQRRDAHGA